MFVGHDVLPGRIDGFHAIRKPKEEDSKIVGMDLHTKGAFGFVADATYHWILATGTDTDFIALRLGLEVPMMR